MAIFNFLENFFFISLAITFGLLLLLVYHFKERMSIVEKKSDTLNEVLTHVVKELKTMRLDMIRNETQKPVSTLGNTIIQDNTKYIAIPSNSAPVNHGSETAMNASSKDYTPHEKTLISEHELCENISYVISDVGINMTIPNNVLVADARRQPNKIVVSDESDSDEESEDEDESNIESDSLSESESEPEPESAHESESESESDSDEDSDCEEEKQISGITDTPNNRNDDDAISIGGISIIDEAKNDISNEKLSYIDDNIPENDIAKDIMIEVNNIIDEAIVTASESPIVVSEIIVDSNVLMVIPKNDAHVHRFSENAISASSEDFNPPEKTLTGEEKSLEDTHIQQNIDISSNTHEDNIISQKDSKLDTQSHDPKHVVYSKMSINQLRTIAISSGLATDTSKMKKAELIKLLKNLEEDESEEE
jgi:hypothetical protein